MNKFSNILQALEFWSRTAPGKTFYTYLEDGESKEAHLTVGELDELSGGIARELKARKAEGRPVVLIFRPGLAFIPAFFGALKAGAIAVPLYPPDPARLEQTLPQFLATLEDSRAGIVLTTEDILALGRPMFEGMPGLKDIDWIGIDSLKKEGGGEGMRIFPDAAEDGTALLEYTSGSTGSPKGVMISHGNLIANVSASAHVSGLGEETVFVCWLPFQHNTGLMSGVLLPLYCGSRGIILSPLSVLEDPLRVFRAVTRYRGAVVASPNFLYEACARKADGAAKESLDLSSLEFAIAGMEVVSPEALDEFETSFAGRGLKPEALHPSYGLSEATLLVSIAGRNRRRSLLKLDQAALEKGEARAPESDERNVSSIIGCGRPLPGIDVRIVDASTKEPCPEGRIGEIWLRGPSVAKGYWNRPEETRETFGVFLAQGEGPFLNTGDLGFLRDGEIFVAGRTKDLIIIRGKNHYPQDIEKTVEACHPALRPGCGAAFSVRAGSGEKLVVVHELERRGLQDGGGVSRDERRSHDPQVEIFTPAIGERASLPSLADEIAAEVGRRHQVGLHALVFVRAGSIPRTRNGKVQRLACRKAFEAGELSELWRWETSGRAVGKAADGGSEERDKTDWEKYVAAVWARHLKREPGLISPGDNFFQLGGDSLSAVSVACEMSRRANRRLEENLVYKYPGLKELSAHMEGSVGPLPDEASPEDPRVLKELTHPDRREFPLLPLQQSFFVNHLLGDSLCYVCGDLKLTGDLNRLAFERALRISLSRHPSLRLAYRLGEAGPVQYDAGSSAEIPLETRDLSGAETESARDRLRQELVELARYPFSLASGKNFAARLVKTGPDEHHLLVNINHLAIDGFSLPRYFEDLFEVIYPSVIAGRPVEGRPQTSLTFKEYCEIRDGLADPGKRRSDIDYWLARCDGAQALMAPPRKRGAGAVPFGLFWQSFDDEIVRNVKRRAMEGGVTFFAVLFAVFFQVMARRYGSDDFVINTPLLNRAPYAGDVLEILGCFTDILPVRLSSVLEASASALASEIQSQLAEMMRRNSVSGVELARILAQKAGGGARAVSPVIFSSALFPGVKAEARSGLELEVEGIRTGAPATALDVVIGENGSGLFFSWNFNPASFEAAEIADLARDYLALLRSYLILGGQTHATDSLTGRRGEIPQGERHEDRLWPRQDAPAEI